MRLVKIISRGGEELGELLRIFDYDIVARVQLKSLGVVSFD